MRTAQAKSGVVVNLRATSGVCLGLFLLLYKLRSLNLVLRSFFLYYCVSMDHPLILAPEFITEAWLRTVGFCWHEEQQYIASLAKAKEKGEIFLPQKHWILWFGGIAQLDLDGKRGMFAGDEDLGIELAQTTTHSKDQTWHCWLRSDLSRRYSRFIHLRHLRTPGELVCIVVAITGHAWNPENHLYGCVRTPEQAKAIRSRDLRTDVLLAKSVPWYESEKDDSSGAADITDLRINREKEGLA